MSAQRPRVRLPLTDGSSSEDSVLVELPPSARRSNTFSISYADQWPGNSRLSGSVTSPQPPILESSEGEGNVRTSEEGESENDVFEDRTRTTAAPISTNSKLRPAAGTTGQHQFQQNTPHFSRTMSMPLPSQLGHLQHPHRPQTRTIYSSPITPSIHSTSPIKSLSLELADSFQMVIQTMLQISPPQLLESAKEQYSACSLSVPTPSMSAMFTAMKTLNYMSANLFRLYHGTGNESGSFGQLDGDAKVQNVFDIGELLQSVGDTLSGVAAQAGVDLVLHHGEIGVRHVYVKGDECGILYALLHILRQILDKAHAGDLIELGLNLTLHGVQSTQAPAVPEEGGRVTASPVDMESLHCTIKIEHKYGPNAPADGNEGPVEDQETTGEAPAGQKGQAPQISSVLRRLLRLIDADFMIADNVEDGQAYEVGLLLVKTASPASKVPQSLSGNSVLVEEPSGSDTEPSVEQLLAFGETLKSRKVTFYANSANTFTRHITNYLATWGMDVTQVFSDNSSETSIDEGAPTPIQETRLTTSATHTASPPEAASNSASRPAGQENQPQISFVLIDDDVGILRERLHALRVEQNPLNLNARARPSLAALHRPRSSPQIARVLAQSTPSPRPPSVVVLHFTSLANFKATKDVIQTVMSTYSGSGIPVPEVMIIPKPVGPRRFLTAMHTAVTRPTIDSFFFPTATTPGTSSAQPSGSFFPAPSDPNSNNQSPQSGTLFNRATRPHGSRSNSDRSTKEHLLASLPSPSPLGIPDNAEYFPDPNGKLGQSPSSGYLVSSPDGQPAGILFHPRSKKNTSPQSMERVGNQTATVQRRTSVPRLFPVGAQSFHALHEASQPQTPRLPVEPSPIVESAGKKGGKNASPSDGNIVPPISVLIVDDNPINQTILSTFMKRKKIRYGIANNGKEAVEKWKTGGFHLILMDIQMPIMDGIEATREIRRMEKLNAASEFPPSTPFQISQTPVSTPSSTATSDMRSTSASSPYRLSVIIVALTASSLQSDRVSALAAGCNDFLTKPVSLLWLNNKIIEWGSIKALQMWADIRPEAVWKMSRGQQAQARAIADRLQMPKSRGSPAGRSLINVTQADASTLAAAVALANTTPVAEALITGETQNSGGDAPADIQSPANAADKSVSSSSFPRRKKSHKREGAPESLKRRQEAKAVEPKESTYDPGSRSWMPADQFFTQMLTV
ncbi:Response regulator mcs4 [Leucoagaricus sp. SymC.cos]|nr:Response regulator mcs4 [Leucoagaricus sp. SymC.cos]